jgi:hypothetical protein
MVLSSIVLTVVDQILHTVVDRPPPKHFVDMYRFPVLEA